MIKNSCCVKKSKPNRILFGCPLFRKLLASHATQRWGQEIQEGVYDMLEIFIDLIVTRLNAEEKLSKEGDAKTVEVPHLMLRILAQAFDLKTDWNVKNRHRGTRTGGNR